MKVEVLMEKKRRGTLSIEEEAWLGGFLADAQDCAWLAEALIEKRRIGGLSAAETCWLAGYVAEISQEEAH